MIEFAQSQHDAIDNAFADKLAAINGAKTPPITFGPHSPTEPLVSSLMQIRDGANDNMLIKSLPMGAEIQRVGV